MAKCAVCGERVSFGGRRLLRRMRRVEKLASELERAQREAQKEVPETPPEVRSALLEVAPLLERLIANSRGLTADLHDAAHDRSLLVDDNRVRDWESAAERVLTELLATLESSIASDPSLDDD